MNTLHAYPSTAAAVADALRSQIVHPLTEPARERAEDKGILMSADMAIFEYG